MKFIGVDLTSAFPPNPRCVDVAVLDDDRNVTFYTTVWPGREAVVNRNSASFISMIFEPLGCDPNEPFILAVDGPQGLANSDQTQRACERILGTPGRTSSQLPPPEEGEPFQGYIRSSIDLFAALCASPGPTFQLSGLEGILRNDANLFEVFPGAEWVVLAGKRLPGKKTVPGRQERKELFRRLGLVMPAESPLPTADQNDALVGSYLAWCVRHNPRAVDQFGNAPTILQNQIREGFILHATVCLLDTILEQPAAPLPEDDIRRLAQPAQEAPEDWNEDQDLFLFLTDNGLVHGGEPENAWLVPGRDYALETVHPDGSVRFQLNHSPNFPGGLGWRAVPIVQRLLAELGRPAPQHLSRQDGVTLRVRRVD